MSEARALADRTWQQVPLDPTVLVPVGSLEQHGPHLPLDTDARVATSVAQRAAAANSTLLLAPAVGYAASGEHEGFPGTISIGHAALYLLLVELGRSACRWASRVVLVNGHGGNFPTLPQAATTLRAEGREVAWFTCNPPRRHWRPDVHAGRVETSLMLALTPELVNLEVAAAGDLRPLPQIIGHLRAGGVQSVSPNGVLGDPAGASAAEGEELLDAMAVELRTALTRWRPGADGRL